MRKDANIELMRLVFMFMICMVHAVGYVPDRWRLWITNISFVGVIGFVLISGYFGIKFKFSKALKVEGVGIGCAMTVVATAWLCGCDFTLQSALSEVLRLFKGYWFIHAYVVMMVLASLIPSAAHTAKVESSIVHLHLSPSPNSAPPPASPLLHGKDETDSTTHHSSLVTHHSPLSFCLPFFVLIYGWSFLMLIPGVQRFIPRSAGLESYSGLTLFATYLVGRLYCLYDCDNRWSWHRVLPVFAISLLFVATLWPFDQFSGAFARYNSPFLVVAGVCAFWCLRKIPVSDKLMSVLFIITPSVLSIYLLHCNDYGFKMFGLIEKNFQCPCCFVTWLALAVCAFAGGVVLDVPRRLAAYCVLKIFDHANAMVNDVRRVAATRKER